MTQPPGNLGPPSTVLSQDDLFAERVHAVLRDFLGLPPEFLDYINQYLAVNPLPIPYSQIVGGPPV